MLQLVLLAAAETYELRVYKSEGMTVGKYDSTTYFEGGWTCSSKVVATKVA